MAQTQPPRPAVLVVEDEVLIRMEAVDMLEDAGFRTYEAGSADAALLVLEKKGDVAFLFTDVDMPGSMDGIKLAAHVNATWPHIRIIVASGILDVKKEHLPPDACFFPKPYPTSEIIQKLQDLRSGDRASCG